MVGSKAPPSGPYGDTRYGPLFRKAVTEDDEADEELDQDDEDAQNDEE